MSFQRKESPMRTNEERIAAMHVRANEIKKEDGVRRNRIIEVSSIAAGIVLVVLLAVAMPGYAGLLTPEATTDAMSASIFSESSALAYIVIGALSFLLGITATLFAFRLKKMGDEEKTNPEKR